MANGFDTVLVFDTETSGLPDYKKSSSHPSQPSVMQLAAALYATPTGCDDWRREAVLYTLIQIGDDATVNEKAQAVHGISRDKANSLGVAPQNALYMFADLCDIADRIVAHNAVFDTKLMKIGWNKAGMEGEFPIDKDKTFCTMMKSINIVQAPKTNGHKGFKWPTLEEAMKHFFGHGVGEELVTLDPASVGYHGDEPVTVAVKVGDAHDALPDVDAAAKVYFKLLELGLV